MTLRVVGAGVGRTGTHSLKLALERLLGEPCYHMSELRVRPDDADVWRLAAEGVAPDWTAFFNGYVAAVDWPASAFWRELATAYPDAVILLSVRNTSQDWWRSAESTIFKVTDEADSDAFGSMVRTLLATRFTTDFANESAAIAAYERHNAEVRRDAPPGRIVEWQPGDGWEPLCAALGVSVPSDPFPHTNARQAFRERHGWDT